MGSGADREVGGRGPVAGLAGDPPPRGQERPGTRTETYEVRFRNEEGETYVWRAPNEAEWRRFEAGGSYRAEVRPGGEIVSVSSDRILGPPDE